jgi:hypothetical protein
MRADRRAWPACTRKYGILLKGQDVNAAALHRLLGAVYLARQEAWRARMRILPPMHAWREAEGRPAGPYTVDFARIPDEVPRWTFGARLMRAMKAWLSALRWTDGGEVSNIELAFDFEIFTGVDIPGPPDAPVPANRRARTLGHMLAVLGRICEDLQLPPPLPAQRVARLYCLRTMGAPVVCGGLSRRPHFAAGEETSAVLEASLEGAIFTAGLADGSWGGDVFPRYDAQRRADRARRWEAAGPRLVRSERPVPVPSPQADTGMNGRAACNACAKAKCAVCAGVPRHYAPTVDQCCQAHHRPDDGLPVQCCPLHHLTRCGGCTNATECCKKGHHRQGGADDDHAGPAAAPRPPPAMRRDGTDDAGRDAGGGSRRAATRTGRSQPEAATEQRRALRRKRSASRDSDVDEDARTSARMPLAPAIMSPPRRRPKRDPSGVT